MPKKPRKEQLIICFHELWRTYTYLGKKYTSFCTAMDVMAKELGIPLGDIRGLEVIVEPDPRVARDELIRKKKAAREAKKKS